MSNLKLLNINSYFFSSTVHKELQDNLKKAGVTTVTFAPVSKGYDPREECRYPDLPDILRVECFYSWERYFFFLKHSRILAASRNIIDIDQFDIIHAHSLFSNGYIAWKLCKKNRMPYVVTVRDTDINVFLKKMKHLRNTGIQVLKNADQIIFLSVPHKNEVLSKYVPAFLRKKIELKSKIIPNGVADFWHENTIQHEKSPSNQLKLLQVGEISRRKNQLLVLDAIKKLNKLGNNIQYTVVGKVKNEKIYTKLKSSEYVKLISQVNKEQLLEIYRAHDIFIMPSLTETFGLVYVEALSQGLPIIYSKGQGFDGQFPEGEVGYHVCSNSTEDIAEKITLINQHIIPISRRATEAVKHYNWENIARHYKTIYELITL